MSDFDLAVSPSSGNYGAAGLVPVGYAEKAMASLMQLHSEVLDEKERRVDLHRRLMEKEQALAELKMYVKMLEEKLGPPGAVPLAAAAPRAPAERSVERSRVAVPKPPSVARQAPAVTLAGASAARSRPPVDGWKSW